MKHRTRDNIIVLGADHNGIALKAEIKALVTTLGFHPLDVGPHTKEKVDYVDYANLVGSLVNNRDAQYGILVCGTGVGMSIAANRFAHVRASLVHSPEVARKAREHNDANVLCLGAWIHSPKINLEIVRAWLSTSFGEGRHVRRVEKLVGRRKGKIVFTNGIFDIVHKGHLELLQFAKSLGDRLVVGINSDRATKILKGPNRPVHPELERKAALEHFDFVDQVLIFDDTKTIDVVAKVNPDIIVKGGEWTAEEVRRRDNIPSHIEIKICPLVLQPSGDKYSTTNVISRIKQTA